MALAIGNNAMKGAYLGTNQVRRAYKGGTLVYQGFGPVEEQEFIQQEATGGPAQLLKVYGKSVVDAGSLQSNKTAELRAYDGGTLRGSLALNLSTLTGKLNGEGASVVVFPDGLRGVGTDRDAAYGSTGEVARAVVDLGQLNWAKNSDPRGTYFWARIPNAKAVADYLVAPNAICSNYQVVSGANRANKTICQYNPDTSGEWMIYDSVYDSADAATFKTAMSGVMLDYPLATPLTYTLDTPLPTDLTCEQGDILQRVSDNNCPFVGEMKFGL